MPETQPTNTAPPQPGDEPLPGYRLLAPLGRGGYGEVWKCEAPGGLHKAVKFVQGAHGLEGGADVPAAVELRAIERVRAIRHPFLLSLERVEPCGGGLVIVLELADRSLADLVEEQRKAGRPGLARARLLDFLREAAEALDFLNLQHHLLHLDVKPQNLFVIANHVKLGDFSRVHALPPGEEQAPVEPGAFAPLYAPPEVFRNTATRQSDQYSLAIVYQELLTGAFPFQGASARHLLVQHLQGEPDLQSLPAGDRAAVARALAKAPAERFPSCLDFVHALAGGPAELISPPPIAISPVQNPGPEPPALAGDAPALESPEELTLLECVRRTPLTEVYRAQRADGGERLVQVLFGWAGNAADLAGRLNGLHHPALAPRQVAADGRGGLAVVTPPAGRCLRDRLQECLAAGQPGVGRDELLRWLHAAAEVLDFLQQRQKLAHLALHPRNLLLDEGRLRIADFGLVELLWLPAGQPVASLNSRYAAPELAAGQAGPACDQYSLALIYHEMLTGGLPARQAGRPAGLDRLNEADRPVIARALLADPGRRWGAARGARRRPARPPPRPGRSRPSCRRGSPRRCTRDRSARCSPTSAGSGTAWR
jgi:serine/threonine protein kinase